MTAKERKRIYKKIAFDYESDNYVSGFLCGDLKREASHFIERYVPFSEVILKYFPEFRLFSPNKQIFNDGNTWWTEEKKGKHGMEKDKACRIVAMLFCAEMCNDEIASGKLNKPLNKIKK